MTTTLQPIVYLTCEIKGRDFKSRLLIAAHLLKRGYHVIIGNQWGLGLNAPYAPKGCYLFKTANRYQADAMRFCKRHGHAVVASDEEALSTAPHLITHTVDPSTVDLCDRFLALNETHAAALRKAFPNIAGKITVAGTARADLMRNASYKRPHTKPYILVNTSFGFTNSIWGDTDKAIETYANARDQRVSKSEHDAVIGLRLDYERAAMREMETLLPWLIADSGYDIILRPHPNEHQDRWLAVEGLHVVAASESIPWIKHADVMVHNDSTTGIEAAILGTPALNVSPNAAWAQRLIARDVNWTVATADEAIARIAAGLAPRTTSDAIAPLDCAAKTTEAMTALLPRPAPIQGFRWGTYARNDLQKAKITISLEEFVDAMKAVFPIANMPEVPVAELDDTIFLLQHV